MAINARRTGMGVPSAADGFSRVTRKTISGGTMETNPSPTPRMANRRRLSAIYQPSTVATMIASSVPEMENTIR